VQEASARDLHQHGHQTVHETPTTTTASVGGSSAAASGGGLKAAAFATELAGLHPSTAALLKVQQRAVGLLLLAQNLVEGHDRSHQEFMCFQPGVSDTVNLVKEIGGMYMALFEHVKPELRLRTVIPPHGDEEGAGTSGAFRVPAWDKIGNFDRLRVVVNNVGGCL
jgi:hypothetical protein